jgi:Lar family restriction alleviation protein
MIVSKKKVELLPCPFCGSDNVKVIEEIRNIDFIIDDLTSVSCEQCYGRGARAMNGTKKRRIEMAIAAWNRRANDAERL